MRWSKAIAATASAAVISATSSLWAQPLPATETAPQTRQVADCTITGTADNDVLQGTGGKDVICGGGGDDTIDGMAGDDIIQAGGGNDTVDGGSGDDQIMGSVDDDTLKGSDGNDTMNGGDGSDTCRQNRGSGKETSCEWPNPLLICPVAHGTVYNDFGDPRGDHKHEGNDILAKKGEPVLATFPGRTSNNHATGAGMYVTLTRSDGSFTYGMHLSRFRPEDHYGTGDVIGFVGSTGNAGTTNHLHFEWHPDGGVAIDPFPYLSRVCPDSVKTRTASPILEPAP